MATIIQAKEMATLDLMSISGVVGVGIQKEKIAVYVEKLTFWVLSKIPEEILEVPSFKIP